MIETLRSRHARAGPAAARVRAARWRAGSGRRARVGGVERHGGAAPGDARGRHRARRRGRDHPVQLRGLRQLRALRGRPAGVLRHRPAHAQHRRPQAAAAAVTERTTGLLPVHIFGYPADMDGFERLAAERGLWIVEDACEALGAVHADGTAVGARGNLATFGFYPNKQLATGEGGALVCPAAAVKERIDSERNQGRAPDMGWLDHDRLGLQLPALRPRLRAGAGPARAPGRDARRTARVSRRRTRRRWRASRGSTCPAPTRTATAAAGSST